MPLLGRPDQGNLLAEDRLLELFQLLARLEPELLCEEPAGATVGGECVHLALGPVESEHQVTPEPLTVGMLVHERFELLDQLGGQSERELGFDPLLQRDETQILEPLRLELQGAVVRETCEGLPAPELERRAQLLRSAPDRTVGEGRLSLSDQTLEPARVDSLGRDVQGIAGRAAADRILVSERPPQPGDVRAQRRRGVARQLALPELVGQTIRAHGPPGLEQEERQQRPLTGASEPQADAVPDRLDRPEHAKLDRVRARPPHGRINRPIASSAQIRFGASRKAERRRFVGVEDESAPGSLNSWSGGCVRAYPSRTAGSGSDGCGATVVALAPQHDLVGIDAVAEPLRGAGDCMLEQGVGERLDLAAVAADDMVVVVASG